MVDTVTMTCFTLQVLCLEVKIFSRDLECSWTHTPIRTDHTTYVPFTFCLINHNNYSIAIVIMRILSVWNGIVYFICYFNMD